MSIKNTIKAVKEIQEKNLTAYIGDGTFVPFKIDANQPAKEADINNFEKAMNCVIPNDYKEFLLFSNGLIFMEAGDFELFDLDTIISTNKCMSYKKGAYVIGTFLGDYILINSDEINSSNYLYAGPNILYDSFISFGHDFDTFLERLIMTQVQKYWDWYPKTKYFNFSE